MQSSKAIGINEWHELLRLSLKDHTVQGPHGDLLPAFPSDEVQCNTTSLSGEAALRQACGFYSDMCGVLDSSGITIEPDWEILDFGSCWGRISRLFLRDVPLKNIHGLDVDRRFVDICNDLFKSNHFGVCSALPPCEYADSSINLISAYSVFSHLSEAAFMLWMQEFHRILKAGGIVTFTTRNADFFEYCVSLQGRNGLEGYTKALSTMIPDIADTRSRFKAGEFIFLTDEGLGGGGAMNQSFYGESFIPDAYVRRTTASMFEILGFKPSGNEYDQALFVLRKRAS